MVAHETTKDTGTHPLADKSGNARTYTNHPLVSSCLQHPQPVKPRTFPLLLNCAAVNGGGWFVKKLVTAVAW